MSRTPSNISTRLGAAIRVQRKRRNLTLKQLAELSGIDVSQLSKVERGIERTSLDAYESIASRLGVTVASLLSVRSPRVSRAA